MSNTRHPGSTGPRRFVYTGTVTAIVTYQVKSRMIRADDEKQAINDAKLLTMEFDESAFEHDADRLISVKEYDVEVEEYSPGRSETEFIAELRGPFGVIEIVAEDKLAHRIYRNMSKRFDEIGGSSCGMAYPTGIIQSTEELAKVDALPRVKSFEAAEKIVKDSIAEYYASKAKAAAK